MPHAGGAGAGGEVVVAHPDVVRHPCCVAWQPHSAPGAVARRLGSRREACHCS